MTEKLRIKGRTRTTHVILARRRATPAAGRRTTATLKLNAVGRRLLSRRHRLAVVVTVSTGHTRHTEKITLTEPRRRRARR